MRRTLLLFTLVAAMLLACTGVVLAQTTAPAESRPASAEDPIPNQYIVVLDNKEDAKQASKDAEKDHKAKIKHVYEHAIKGFAAELSDSEVDKLKKDNKHKVRFVEQDYKVHETQTTSSQTLPTGDDRIDGEPNPTDASDGTGIDVAVIDTGIDLSHPDLINNAKNGTNCVNPGSPAQDDRGHGTHVAGTIAAQNNGSGVVGVAPGATLYAVKVLDSTGSGTNSQVLCGIDWVTGRNTDINDDGSLNTTNDIEVANMSLGGWVNGQTGLDDGDCGNTNHDSEHQAICDSTNAGVTYAVAAGNDTWPIEDKAYSYWSERPGVYDEVLTVAATADYNGKAGGGAGSTCANYGSDDSPASFSNWSETSADEGHTIAGPGACILSTKMGGGTTTMSGTSMATPHIAGTAALYKAENPSATPAQVIRALRSDADAYDIYNGYGFQKDPNSGMSSGWTSGTHKYYGYLALAGNYRSGVKTPAPPPRETIAPTVSSVSPKDGATGRSVSTNVTATFSEKMKPDTLTSTTFMLAQGTKDTKPPTPTPTTAIPATVTLSTPDGLTATLKSSTNLAKCTWYKAVVKGGSGGAADEAGNTLAADKVWSFKTAC